MAHEGGVVPIEVMYRLFGWYETRIRALYDENRRLQAMIDEKERQR